MTFPGSKFATSALNSVCLQPPCLLRILHCMLLYNFSGHLFGSGLQGRSATRQSMQWLSTWRTPVRQVHWISPGGVVKEGSASWGSSSSTYAISMATINAAPHFHLWDLLKASGYKAQTLNNPSNSVNSTLGSPWRIPPQNVFVISVCMCSAPCTQHWKDKLSRHSSLQHRHCSSDTQFYWNCNCCNRAGLHMYIRNFGKNLAW
jgi:hypothetical protein